MERFPDSPYAQEARGKLVELHFKLAQGKDTVSSYEQFIRKYPGGSKSGEAQNQILNIYARKLSKKKTLKAKEEIENIIIRKISNNGVGTRFTIADILPTK